MQKIMGNARISICYNCVPRNVLLKRSQNNSDRNRKDREKAFRTLLEYSVR